MGNEMMEGYMRLLNQSHIFVKDPVRALANVYEILRNEAGYVRNMLGNQDPVLARLCVANRENDISDIINKTEANFDRAPNMAMYVLAYTLLRVTEEEMGWSRERLTAEIEYELVNAVWDQIEETANPGKNLIDKEFPFNNNEVLRNTMPLSRN
ncbi:hypothetical protein JXB11_02070 [Candidatus Woesearchaeota archaeon]|nr:hypothetical protein [Candidatus Woesearchaeota archaeon]